MSVGSKAELSFQRKAADLKNNKECEAAKQNVNDDNGDLYIFVVSSLTVILSTILTIIDCKLSKANIV